jgi:polyphenol oxidase
MSKIVYQCQLPLGQFLVYDDKPELKNLVHLHQTHSADIVEYVHHDLQNVEGDGIVFRSFSHHELNFAIKTADCMPIIILGENGFCFLHAGWAGLKKGILKHPILKTVRPYFAFIGPSIHQDNFEVQADFLENFPNSPNFKETENKLSFNLQQEAIDQLKLVFPEIKCQNSNECTFANLKYNSYRRDKTPQRNWNIFSIEYNKRKKEYI